MTIDKYVFKRPPETYKTRLDPLREYVKQASAYVSKMEDMSNEEAVVLVKTALKEFKLNNPEVIYKYRQENGDVVMEKDKLTTYIKDIQDRNELLAPSFTSYIHPSVKKSLHADYLMHNIKERSRHKKLAFKYKLEGDKAKAAFHNNMQQTMKIKNNSLSGSYISNGTSLTNPSAHSTLTSTTRCVASIGNATTESVAMGNKIFRNINSVVTYITAILVNVDMDAIAKVMEKYKLHYPTPQEVMLMINRSTMYYFNLPHKMEYISKILHKLTPVERAAVLYVNDLYHFRIFNDEFMRHFISELCEVKTGLSVNRLEDIENVQEGVTNHAHMVCANLIRGKSINYVEMVDTPEIDAIASTCKHTGEILTEYKDFIQAFYVTNVAPINIAYVKDLLRRAIVLSDTDSTCGAYEDWVKWYYKESDFNDNGKYVAVASSVMLVVTQVIDHFIKLLEGNMNVDPNAMELLKMKNEFYWYSFTPMNTSKHYLADTAIQEGSVYAETIAEVKGSNLIASQVAEEYRKISDELRDEIRRIGRTTEEIDLYYFVNKVANVERSIIKKIREGSLDVFALNLIKTSKSYKLAPNRSPYFYHMLWEAVFAPKYGSPGEPAYQVIKVPIELKSTKDLKDYLGNLEDRQLANRLEKFLEENEKKGIGMLQLPYTLIRSKGLPEEVFNCMNYHKIVTASCYSMYILLESIGFYKPANKLIIDLGPY